MKGGGSECVGEWKRGCAGRQWKQGCAGRQWKRGCAGKQGASPRFNYRESFTWEYVLQQAGLEICTAASRQAGAPLGVLEWIMHAALGGGLHGGHKRLNLKQLRVGDLQADHAGEGDACK